MTWKHRHAFHGRVSGVRVHHMHFAIAGANHDAVGVCTREAAEGMVTARARQQSSGGQHAMSSAKAEAAAARLTMLCGACRAFQHPQNHAAPLGQHQGEQSSGRSRVNRRPPGLQRGGRAKEQVNEAAARGSQCLLGVRRCES